MDGLERTLMTIACGDCNDIPKTPDAGRIIAGPDGDVQIMHNGLKVIAGGYHGDWMAHVIRALRGHHEPQEELLFNALLKACRHNSLFVELGSFWAYYSMWYLHEVPGSRAICIEPDPNNKAIGERNARINGLQQRMNFLQGFVGGDRHDVLEAFVETVTDPIALPCYDINAIIELSGNDVIEILHVDVQGAEFPLLTSARDAIEKKKIRFAIISTHHGSISGSRNTHEDCLALVIALGGKILAEHSVQESFSGDGLIVASFFQCDERISIPHISRNMPQLSLFPVK
ncbi:FkbM family methyltransferase [Neorhizobium sp. JUb45]|uniref:FkbM family methyltransferase n=1 Tax=Neorhizobium sp. JUb45 TaxID=2485113 RepID=UPI001042B950|nr:FkbM family methyltransferase [Neorhizobium sp. JUb45]TCR03927.1 FkbM family methyltransferase [Neorhizobium sp. JUb45]